MTFFFLFIVTAPPHEVLIAQILQNIKWNPWNQGYLIHLGFNRKTSGISYSVSLWFSESSLSSRFFISLVYWEFYFCFDWLILIIDTITDVPESPSCLPPPIPCPPNPKPKVSPLNNTASVHEQCIFVYSLLLLNSVIDVKCFQMPLLV